jgi:hypothetical protein
MNYILRALCGLKTPASSHSPRPRIRRLAVEPLEDRRLLSGLPLAPSGVYHGPNWAEASGPMDERAAAATQTALSASTLAGLTKQAVTFTATVTTVARSSRVPSGTVDFFDGGVKIGSATLDATGRATFATTSLSVGSHSISAVYDPNSNAFDGSSSPSVTVAISQVFPTETTLAVNNPTIYGQLATMTATVAAVNPQNGVPPGTVIFTDGLTALGTVTLDKNGMATLSGIKLPAGTNLIVASYRGSGQFDPSASATTERDLQPAATSMTLASSAASASVGVSVTFTATLTTPANGAGAPTGTVSFYDGTTLLGTTQLNGSGVATFATAALKAGSHSIRAVYATTTDFLGSEASLNEQIAAGP